MNPPRLTVIALGALLLSHSVLADHHHCGHDCDHRCAPVFSEFDTDNDGQLSSSEYYDGCGRHMASCPQSGCKMRNAAGKPTFEDIDTDGDGVLSQAEFDAYVAAQRGKQR